MMDQSEAENPLNLARVLENLLVAQDESEKLVAYSLFKTVAATLFRGEYTYIGEGTDLPQGIISKLDLRGKSQVPELEPTYKFTEFLWELINRFKADRVQQGLSSFESFADKVDVIRLVAKLTSIIPELNPGVSSRRSTGANLIPTAATTSVDEIDALRSGKSPSAVKDPNANVGFVEAVFMSTMPNVEQREARLYQFTCSLVKTICLRDKIHFQEFGAAFTEDDNALCGAVELSAIKELGSKEKLLRFVSKFKGFFLEEFDLQGSDFDENFDPALMVETMVTNYPHLIGPQVEAAINDGSVVSLRL